MKVHGELLAFYWLAGVFFAANGVLEHDSAKMLGGLVLIVVTFAWADLRARR